MIFQVFIEQLRIWVDRLVEIKKAEFSDIEDGFESESSSQNINTGTQTSFDRSDMVS